MNEKTADALQKASKLLSENSCFVCGGRIEHDDGCIMNDVDHFFKMQVTVRMNRAKNLLWNNGFTSYFDNDGRIYDVKPTEVAPCKP